MAKKITITKDLKKETDIIIGDSGIVTFTKRNIIIRDECTDCKAKKIILNKIINGNPDAEIIKD